MPALVKASQTSEVAKEVFSKSHPELGQCWPVITAGEGRGRLPAFQRWSLLLRVCIFSTIELSGLEKKHKKQSTPEAEASLVYRTATAA